jgi:phage replication-related protein YjqB (UPF0714/DUF867 family)
MPDRYASFAELSQHEREGVDYAIELQSRDSAVAVIAPHGGFIEPNTTEIARAIAAAELSFYGFAALRRGRPHSDLHLTSHKFDEPRCLALLAKSDVAIAVHGRRDIDDPRLVYLGGLDTTLRERLRETLAAAGFEGRFDAQRYPGTHPSNICNRGRSGRGVQLELPRSLRDRLAREPQRLARFAASVRAALGAG